MAESSSPPQSASSASSSWGSAGTTMSSLTTKSDWGSPSKVDAARRLAPPSGAGGRSGPGSSVSSMVVVIRASMSPCGGAEQPAITKVAVAASRIQPFDLAHMLPSLGRRMCHQSLAVRTVRSGASSGRQSVVSVLAATWQYPQQSAPTKAPANHPAHHSKQRERPNQLRFGRFRCPETSHWLRGLDLNQ